MLEALFRNLRPNGCRCRTAIARMLGCLPPAERVRCQQPSQRGLTQVQTRQTMKEEPRCVRLGIGVACKADHQASRARGDGELWWSGWRFRATPGDLEALWAEIPHGAEVQVISEPTRNAWVPSAAG